MKTTVLQPGDVPADLTLVAGSQRPAPGRIFDAPELATSQLSPEELEAGRAQRRALHAKLAPEQVALDTSEEAEESSTTSSTEDLESIELQIPNGRIILYSPSRGTGAKALVLGRIMGLQANAVLSTRCVETLLNIRAIDGQPVTAISNMVQAQQLLDRIGDDGYEHLALAHNVYWPPATPEDLRVLKKNHRRA